MILHPEWTWDTIPDEYVEDVVRAAEICSPGGCSECPIRTSIEYGVGPKTACLCWLPIGDDKVKLLERFNDLVYEDLPEDIQEKLITLLTKN